MPWLMDVYPKPLGSRVLVKTMDPQKGKFRRPTMAENMAGQTPPEPEPARGIVTAVGPGMWVVPLKEYAPMHVEVGDEVLFFEQAGQLVRITDEELWLLEEENILVVLSRVEREAQVDAGLD